MHHFDHIVASLCFERDGVSLPIFPAVRRSQGVVMSSVCIQVINPNTSTAMTETIGAAARAVAAPGTEILAVRPRAGVPSIEGHFDEAIAAVGVLEQIRAGREQGWMDM